MRDRLVLSKREEASPGKKLTHKSFFVSTQLERATSCRDDPDIILGVVDWFVPPEASKMKLSIHRGGQRQLLLQPLDPATWNANLAYVECMWAVVNLSRLTRGLQRDTSEIPWMSDGYHRRYGKRQAKSRLTNGSGVTNAWKLMLREW